MNASPIQMHMLWIIVAWLFACGTAWSDTYPNKPLRLIVVAPAGGGADILARPIAKKLSDAFGQQVIIDNRGGGAGLLGSQAALSSRPDGYTMMFANAVNMSVAPAIRKDLPLDPVKDFAPVTMVATTPLLFAAHPSLPARSINEFISLAKARPSEILFASNGEGTIQHLTIEMFSGASGIKVTHIPHKGGPPAVLATVGGHTQAIITAIPTLLAQVKSSRLRALAVTSLKRTSVLPEIPTIAESGWPDFEAIQWYGIFAPGKTPVAVIRRWSDEVRRAAEITSVKEALSQEGAILAVNGPEALAEFQRADIMRWRKVVRDNGIVLQ
jgi:tripartite-type tricarboxylate transporter receptor subunit TctC